jgi:MtN3 and saliva related transmembrane protein
MFIASTKTQKTIAFMAVGIAFLGYFPQVYKIIQNKSADDISYLFLIFLIVATVLWITYGILRQDLLLALAYCAGLTMTTIVLVLKIKYSKQLEQS